MQGVLFGVAAEFCQTAETIVPGAAVHAVVLSEQRQTLAAQAELTSPFIAYFFFAKTIQAPS